MKKKYSVHELYRLQTSIRHGMMDYGELIQNAGIHESLIELWNYLHGVTYRLRK